MFRIFSVFAILFATSVAHADNPPMAVHFIDVGQGDSIFIQSPEGKTMLIDAGEKNGLAEKYLNSIGVKTIDVLVATHPHLDHIGGLTDIVKKFEVKSVVMPRVTNVTTVTYRQLLEAIQAKGLRITEGKAGLVINFGGSVLTECLAPNNTQYEDLNDYSIVLKMTYGDVSFLFTGDATTLSESEMLKLHKDKLKTTVLKVPHHGSTSSSSAVFLKEVNPEITVFSVGKGNSYGHPTQTVLNRVNNTYLFRTDMQGSVILATQGKTLAAYSPPINGSYSALAAAQTPVPVTVAAQPEPKVATQYPQAASTDTVYVTKSGAKYHKAGCQYLTNPIAITRQEAISKNYTPCAVCKP